jgi:hypothetical protein
MHTTVKGKKIHVTDREPEWNSGGWQSKQSKTASTIARQKTVLALERQSTDRRASAFDGSEDRSNVTKVRHY